MVTTVGTSAVLLVSRNVTFVLGVTFRPTSLFIRGRVVQLPRQVGTLISVVLTTECSLLLLVTART